MPRVSIAGVTTPEDAGARLDALQTLRTGKVPEIIVPNTVEPTSIELIEFDAPARMTSGLAKNGMFPHAYNGEVLEHPSPSPLVFPEQMDAVLGALAHSMQGR